MYANWKIWFYDRDGDDIRTSTDTLWKEWLLKHTIIRYFLHPDADCKRTPSGTEYLGLTNTTSDGNKCLPWVNMPNTILPYGSHESNINYCRTARQPGDHRPDFEDTPWCYNLRGHPNSCDIAPCGKTLFDECHRSKTWSYRLAFSLGQPSNFRYSHFHPMGSLYSHLISAFVSGCFVHRVTHAIE